MVLCVLIYIYCVWRYFKEMDWDVHSEMELFGEKAGREREREGIFRFNILMKGFGGVHSYITKRIV